jgi:4-hydroxybenzoate polyprenyltransferase
LFWPCAFAAILVTTQGVSWWVTIWHIILFIIGAVMMRGAGCTYNDIVDRDLDAKVARTAGRPLPSGQVSLAAAAAFVIAQLLAGLIVLLQFNVFTIGLGIASIIPIAIYPFMKRITQWPQAVLGLAFNWGALVGWSAATGGLALAPVLLYVGCWAWTMGYDTIYAHQDKDDDAMIGIGSTALVFGDATKPALWIFYGLAVAMWTLAGITSGLNIKFLVGMAIVGGHLAWQIIRVRLDDPESCLLVFRMNRETGALVFAALGMGALLA